MGTEQEIFVAGRGDGADPGGLFRYRNGGQGWSGERLARVEELAALARHPHLPVVYGVSGIDDATQMHAWRVDGPVETLAVTDAGGRSPCHVVVHPAGRLLIATNYSTGTLATWAIDEAGKPADAPTLTPLAGSGSGVEPDRQDGPHPHQAVISGDQLLVPDLGADLVRRFAIDAHGVGEEAEPLRVPPGTGPRHLAQRPDGSLVVSGELAQTIAVIAGSECVTAPSTERSGAARTRSERNYPGDLQLSNDGTVAYLANRGHDTVAAFRLAPGPTMIAEVDTGVRWPQHLLVTDDALLVAGWDSSEVVSMPLDGNGIPGPARPLFDCPGAAWLLS